MGIGSRPNLILQRKKEIIKKLSYVISTLSDIQFLLIRQVVLIKQMSI